MDKYNKTEWIANETLVAASSLNKIENQLTLLTQDAIYQEEVNIRVSDKIDDIVAEQNELNEQVNDAKTDYFKKQHFNLVDRLNSDFDNVHQRINDSNYIEYNGSNIQANNSYYGLTKDLAVKGRTLVNSLGDLYHVSPQYVVTDDDYSLDIEYRTGQPKIRYNLPQTLKQEKEYTLIANVLEYEKGRIHVALVKKGQPDIICSNEITTRKPGFVISKFTTNSQGAADSLRIIPWNGDANKWTLSNKIILLEGDYTNIPVETIPFIEGIQSVAENQITEEGKYPINIKSYGKNLFKGKLYSGWLDNIVDYGKADNIVTELIKVELNKSYIPNDTGFKYVFGFNDNGEYIGYVQQYPFTNTEYSYVRFGKSIAKVNIPDRNAFNNFQVEQGTSVTDYEPYQESTHELQLAEPLRSLSNGVCDEILEDGTEIRRVMKYVFNGNENFVLATTDTDYQEGFTTVFSRDLSSSIKHGTKLICDKFKFYKYDPDFRIYKNEESCSEGGGYMRQYFRISNDKLTTPNVAGFRDWLSKNPVTIYYELAQPIITKHNKNINLETFKDTTYITSTNTLPAVIGCKVSSNAQEIVANLITENEALNNKISTLNLENETIKTINTTQDELINTTMLATDEMYTMLEPLLVNMFVDSKTATPLINMYIAMIKRGLKTEDEVPAKYRDQVKKKLHQ